MATLQLLYSGGTLDLLDTTNYVAEAEGWTPNVTYLRDSDFGGVGPYAEVDEEIAIAANGGTAAARYANLRNLAVAMDEATRWARGEQITNPVRLRYGQTSGGAGTLECVILGRPRGGDHPFGLGPGYPAASNIADGNVLRFRRRGLWLETSETSQAASGTASNRMMTVSSFTTHPTASPVRVEITNCSRIGTTEVRDVCGQVAYLLCVSGQSALQSFAALQSASAPISSVAEAGTFSGNIARYTTNGAQLGRQTYSNTVLSSAIRGSRIIHVFVNLRASSGSCPTVRLQARAYRTGVETLYDAPSVYHTPNATGTNNVFPVYLGALPVGGSLDQLHLDIQAVASAPSEYVDLDAVAVLGENDNYARIIAVGDAGGGSAETITYDHGLATRVEPLVSRPTNPAIPYRGNPALMMTGTTFSAIYFAGRNSNFTNSNGVGNHVMTVHRRRGFYLPE